MKIPRGGGARGTKRFQIMAFSVGFFFQGFDYSCDPWLRLVGRKCTTTKCTTADHPGHRKNAIPSTFVLFPFTFFITLILYRLSHTLIFCCHIRFFFQLQHDWKIQIFQKNEFKYREHNVPLKFNHINGIQLCN